MEIAVLELRSGSHVPGGCSSRRRAERVMVRDGGIQAVMARRIAARMTAATRSGPAPAPKANV
jgi:hypothetical protein